jgi:hypothetical protein
LVGVALAACVATVCLAQWSSPPTNPPGTGWYTPPPGGTGGAYAASIEAHNTATGRHVAQFAAKVPTSRTLTIDGVTKSLASNLTFTTSGGTGTVTSVEVGGTNYLPDVGGKVTLPTIAGPAGTNGTNGTNGAPGAAATIAVGTVVTGAVAAVTNSGTSSAAVFDFVLQPGPQGPQGPAGTNTVAGIDDVLAIQRYTADGVYGFGTNEFFVLLLSGSGIWIDPMPGGGVYFYGRETHYGNADWSSGIISNVNIVGGTFSGSLVGIPPSQVGAQSTNANLTAWAAITPASKVSTNAAAYLAALTNAQFAAQDGVTIVGRTVHIGTNLLGGTAGGGTLQDAVTAQGGTPVTNVPALTLASGAALSMSGTLSAQGSTNNVGFLAGTAASGLRMHNFGNVAGMNASGDYMHNWGHYAGDSASGYVMHNAGYYAGSGATGDYMHNFGYHAGYYGNGAYNHSLGLWAGRNAAGTNQLYIGAHAADPGAGWNPTNDQIYVDGNTGDMSLGHPDSTNHIRSKWIFDSADLAFFGGESLADYVAAHGGGGTSLVIEASSSIAVATSGVTRTLSVKTGVFQPTNSTLTTLAAGTATPILGTSGTKAAAGDHEHATYITADTATNIARTVAWAPGLTPYALTAASTVTVTRAMLTTNAASITLTGNTVLSLTTNGWTTAEIARWSLDITKGAHTLGFDTAVYDNTTVLDTSATRVALFFRKQVGDTKHKVRQ